MKVDLGILRSKKAGLVVAGLFAAAVALLGGLRLIEGPSVRAYVVERADLVQTVVASGRVESPRRVEIGSSLTGVVERVAVDEGQNVAAGQLLIALDTSELRAAVEQARFAVEQAEAKLVQIRKTSLPVAAESVRQAQVNLANAERSLERSRELFDKGFIGQAALDESQRARDVADSQLKSAQVQHESESPGGTDVRLAEAALAQARANLAAAQARLELATIEAPVAGVLISRNVEAGNVVQPGKALLVLSPAGATQLVVQIDEKNLGMLALGHKALASADAYPDQRFECEVVYINPGIDPSRGSVEVKLAVPQAPAYLLQDMTVSVDIEVARVRDVLSVPADAIHDGNWVLVARNGRAERRDVQLGVRGEGRVQVVAGLREGEIVLPSTIASIGEGTSVRASLAKPARKRPT
ncbi:MAG: efflux RND transporter periplasmic adaptor subunit [Bacillota bacterium]